MVTRKDSFGLSFDEIEIEKDFNIRYDMGNLHELLDSIVENGITKTISVYMKKGSNKYTLIDGHRRYYASKMGIESGRLDKELFRFPAMKMRPVSIEQRTLNLITHNLGKPLTMLEEAMVYERLLNYNMSPADVAKKAAKSPTHIANCMTLMTAGLGLRNMIKQGLVSSTLVVELLENDEPFIVEKKLKTALRKKLAKYKAKIKGKAGEDLAAISGLASAEIVSAVVQNAGIATLVDVNLHTHSDIVIAEDVNLQNGAGSTRIIKVTAKDMKGDKPKNISFNLDDMKKCYEEGQMSVRILNEGEKYEPKTFEQYMHSLKNAGKIRKRIPIKPVLIDTHKYRKAN